MQLVGRLAGDTGLGAAAKPESKLPAVMWLCRSLHYRFRGIVWILWLGSGFKARSCKEKRTPKVLRGRLLWVLAWIKKMGKRRKALALQPHPKCGSMPLRA